MVLIDRRRRAERKEMQANATTLHRLLVQMWDGDRLVPPDDAQWLKQVARERHDPIVRTIALRTVGWAAVGGRIGDLRLLPCPADDLHDFVSILREAAQSPSEAERQEAHVALGRVDMYPAVRDPRRFDVSLAWSGPDQTLLSERRQSLGEPFPTLVTTKELIARGEDMVRKGATEDAMRWLLAVAQRYKGLLQEDFAVWQLLKAWPQRTWSLRLRPGASRALHADIVRYTCGMLEDGDSGRPFMVSHAIKFSEMRWQPQIRAALRRCCDDESTMISLRATHAMLADVWK